MMNRIYHTWDKWECYLSGFFDSTHKTLSDDECEKEYALFFKNNSLFEETLEKIIKEWKYSCEHNLTNENMNRIAWLGQASICYHKNIPSRYKSGFRLLSEQEQRKANKTALKFLNIWLANNGYEKLSEEESHQKTKQVKY